MKCPSCGEQNPSYVVYCGKCGAEIPSDVRAAARNEPEVQDAPSASPSAGQTGQGPSGKSDSELNVACAWCGTLNKRSARFCSYCGKDPRGGFDEGFVRDEPPSPEEQKSSTGTLIAGGILSILAGVLALGQGILYLTAESIVRSLYGSSTGFLCLCGGLDILFGMGAIAAGIFSFQRKHYQLAVIGAVLGMLGLGLLVGFVLGLVALIAIAVSRQSFED